MPTFQVQVPLKIKKPVMWFIRYWRPAMAWQYLIVCLFDFMIAPILWTGYQGLLGIRPLTEWIPITNNLYHMSMAPIVGIYTWQRTKEKMAMIKNGNIQNVDPEDVHEDNPSIPKG